MAEFALAITTRPMEAKLQDVLPAEVGVWQYEPKWDGFRCLAFKEGASVDLRAKSGKPLGRYFPELVERLRSLPSEHFVLDGEIIIEIDGKASFEALQMRLHPAESRIRKLAAETPAQIVLFDMLAGPDGTLMLDRTFTARRSALENFVRNNHDDAIRLSPATRDVTVARAWLRSTKDDETDGVVAKRLNGTYLRGERAMVKVKRLRTADCVVGGFRYLTERREVGSLLLGLFDEEGKLNHVGFTSAISDEKRPELTKRLEGLREPPGFTGRAPGGPSRWSTERTGEWEPLRPKLVVEVRFDRVTGERFRHGTKFLRWRPHKAPEQCTFDQIS